MNIPIKTNIGAQNYTAPTIPINPLIPNLGGLSFGSGSGSGTSSGTSSSTGSGSGTGSGTGTGQTVIINYRPHLAPKFSNIRSENDFIFCFYAPLGFCKGLICNGLCNFHIEHKVNAEISNRKHILYNGEKFIMGAYLKRPQDPNNEIATVCCSIPELVADDEDVEVNLIAPYGFSEARVQECRDIHASYLKAMINPLYDDPRISNQIIQGRNSMNFYNYYVGTYVSTYDYWIISDDRVIDLSRASSFTRVLSSLFLSGIPPSNSQDKIINPVIVAGSKLVINNSIATKGTLGEVTGTLLTSPLYFDPARSNKKHTYVMFNQNIPRYMIIDFTQPPPNECSDLFNQKRVRFT